MEIILNSTYVQNSLQLLCRGCEDEGGTVDHTEPSKYYSTASSSSNAEDDRLEEGLEILLNSLNITGQPPAMMLRM
jgi:hypothetical protein